MKKLSLLFIFVTLIVLSSCNRKMESTTYSQTDTIGVVVEGEIVSARQVTIKANDKLEDNKLGGLAGGVGGAVAGSGLGKGRGSTLGGVGGAVAGAVVGAMLQDALSTSSGMEYIVKITSEEDNSYAHRASKKYGKNNFSDNIKSSVAVSEVRTKLISVVQGMDEIFKVGQKVYVVYGDDNRGRLISR